MELRHPFISNPRLAIYYTIFWLVAGSAMVLISTFVSGVAFGISVVEVFSFVIVYALIGSAIWYVIKFTTLEDHSVPNILFAHFIAASIIVFVWIYFEEVIIRLFHSDTDKWIEKIIVVRIFFGYMFYIIYVIFFYAINYYQGFKEKVKNESKLISLVKEAELHALKSQINPHFLFNSLNSISSLTMSDSKRAQEMVINLSQLMRYSLKHNQKELVTFKQELENNKLYLNIEKVRFGNKLNPIFEIEGGCLNAKIPNMILQPLYENAIKYGVYEATEPVDLITRCKLNGDLLEVVIRNTFDSDIQNKKGEGIGLRNIYERMQIIYGNPHLLNTVIDGNEFIVTLTIPQNIK